MDRKHYDDDHLAFADAFRAFADKSLVPNYLDWEKAGIAPREIFQEAGRSGFLGMAVPEEYGGGGVPDFRFNQILDEQIAHAGVTGAGLGISLHNDTCLPYFLSFCNDEQKQRWLPGIVSGELITAVAMTEPGAGSDLAGMRTSAKRDGDSYVVNGAKTFITNGINADLVITAVKTGNDANDRRGGMSLMILERGMAGFERGRNLDKLGLHSQDTAELSFTDVRVPADNLLGDRGRGLRPAHPEAAAGTHLDRGQRRRRGHRRVRRDPAVRPGPQGVRQVVGVVPEHEVRAGRRSPPRSRSRRPTSTAASTGSTPASSAPPTPRRRSTTAPSCRAGSSTSACSCTAATAT